MKNDFDFAFSNHGSICVLMPLTRAARAWLECNVINEETQIWAGGVVVEPRYVGALVQGIYQDGFTIDGIKPVIH